MSYIVLARKYRPQSFGEIYAQEHITQILSNAIKNNRLAHAYLFTGPRGVGKTSMARILAKSLNCVHGPTITPCEVCSNCREITAGTSNDVIEIDGASNTSVDDVRELQKELIYAPSNSLYKIYIIDEVHMLSKNAFNALLKTLEEPPENVLFIFATTEAQKVLPTIISRCQRFDFKRIPVEAITARLKEIAEKEHITVDLESLYLIARKSDGGMRDALSLMDQVLSYADGAITAKLVEEVFGELPLDMYLGIMETIVVQDAPQMIRVYQEIANKGIDLVEFINSFLEFLRNVLLLKMGLAVQGLMKEDVDRISALLPSFTQQTIMYMMSMLIQLKQDIRNSSHPALMIEVVLIKMTRLEELEDISTLIARMASLPAETQVPREKPAPKPVVRPVTQPPEPTKEEAIELDYVAPKMEEVITREYIIRYWQAVADRVKKEKKYAGIFLDKEKVSIVDFKNDVIYLDTESKQGHKFINDNLAFITQIVSDYFHKPLKISLRLVEPAPKVIKKLPTLQEIARENPDLAKLIELTNAVILPGRVNEK